MKKTFQILFLLASVATYAGESSLANAEQYICYNKVILQFRDGVTEQQQESFFKQSELLADISKSIRLHYPLVIIARLKTIAKDYKDLKNVILQLQLHQEVLCANPVFRSERGNEISVLRKVFVKTGNAEKEKLLKQLAVEVGFEIIGPYSFNKTVYIISPARTSTLNSLELSCLVSDMNLFEYVHPDLLFSPVVTTNDLLFSRQWNIRNDGTSVQGNGTPGADMSIEEAWTITRGDTSIKIAILDSGVDTSHQDLRDNMLHGFDATGAGSNGYPNTNFPNDGHGTACAGIAAAVTDNGVGVAGVAPHCKILPVKIFYYVDTTVATVNVGVIPYSTTQWMADGINWAKNAGADVMSNSWGVPSVLFSILPGPVSLAEDAIHDAENNGRNGKGIPMLFSTGNENSTPIWPSTMEETIAVTATSMCDERKSPSSCDGEDWGGNFDGALDIAAPGVKITTTDLPGSKGFSSGSYTFDFNGTSAACPNAAGVMALILSVNPGVKSWDAKYLLASTADRVGGYNYDQYKYGGTWSKELGFGRVNAYSAVTAALNYTGVGSITNDVLFSVYPNPIVSREFTVQFDSQQNSSAMIILSDVNGRIISNKTISILQDVYKIKMEAPPQAGMYFLELMMDQQQHYQKLLFLGE